MKFISKHIKLIFLILIIASLILGLWYKNGSGKKYSRTEFLFDTSCTITAFGNDAETAVSAAFDRVAKIHSLTNFYSSSSDVSRINSAEATEAVTVDEDVIQILSVALDISKASGGAFDVTIAPLSELWGFSKSNPTPPSDEEIRHSKALVCFENILIDREKSNITKTNPLTKIDLGGSAKGYAADCAAEVLKKYNVSGAIIDLGGNVCCFGKNPQTKNQEWRIGVQVPFSPTGEYSEIITLPEGAVVTSGTYQRNFTYNNNLYHHILDPDTGYPADREYSSVTITADNSLLADCLSTACFVLGTEQGSALAEKYNAKILFK